jgi:hypothetical protein
MLQRLLVPGLIVLAAAPAATAAGPVATAARACSLSAKERGATHPSTLGATYVFSLKATAVSCVKAKEVVKSFNACRHKHGKAGRCTSPVKGYRCTEKRTNGVAQFDSNTTCRDGGKTIRFTYTQNT